MTLGDMADFVCGKVRQSDTEAVSRCKGFLRRRYHLIYGEELWKDSLFGMAFTFSVSASVAADLFGPNYFSFQAGIWHLPSGVDKVLGVRSTDHEVPVSDHFQFYNTTPDQFADSGDPVKFFQEGPVVADLRGALSGVESSGVQFSSTAPDNQAVRWRYIDLSGEVVETNGTLPAAGGYSNGFSPQVILSASKAATSAGVTLVLDGETVASAGASALVFPRYPRIRLLPIPSADVSLRALVKLKPQELTDDNDEPQINGIENCLMAFAQHDMLQRARQYGKAQAVVGEAVELLGQLKRVAVVQEAVRQQIVPQVTEVSGDVEEWSGKNYW